MNKRSIETALDPDLRSSLAAMQRAALRARDVARRTGTSIVVSNGGVIEHLAPDAPELAMHGDQDIKAEMGSE